MARAGSPQHKAKPAGQPAAKATGRPRPARIPAVPLSPAMVLQLQRDHGNQATSLMLQRDTPKVAPSPVKEAGALLAGVETWAEEQRDKQKVISTAAVVGLDPKQLASVQQATAKLTALIAPMQASATALDTPFATFKKAMKLAEDAKKASKGPDTADRLEAQHILTESRTTVADAKAQLLKITGGIDVDKIVKDVTTVETWMNNVGNVTDVIKQLNEFLKAIHILQADVRTRADALGRITFLLNGFLEINQPKFSGALSSKDIEGLKRKLHGGITDAFTAVFGSAAEYALFDKFADLLATQLGVREEMTKAGAPATSPVPSPADAKAYFTALAKSPSDAVFGAYHRYAIAYFYHHEIATVADLTAVVPDLMSQAPSITGTRSLVCTGYATVGAQLMSWAGGRTDGYIVGIKASDEMLQGGAPIDDAHALAQVTVRGKTAFISNYEIAHNEEEGIGKEAVDWHHKNNPIFLGRGKTMQVAVAGSLAAMAARRKKLKP